MAKKCSTCKRSYPDHLPACPYCKPARAKAPASDDALVIEDIDLVADEAAPPPKKRQAPPPVPIAAEEVLEVVPEAEAAEVVEAEEVLEPEEVLEADDILEVVPEEAGKGGSSRVKLDEVIDVTETASGVVVGEAEVVAEPASAVKGEDSQVTMHDVAGVPESPSDILLSQTEVVEAAAEPPAAPPAPKMQPPAPTPPVPPKKRAVPMTQVATRAPAPTMLAGGAEPEELPASELRGPAAAAAGESPTAVTPTPAVPPKKRAVPMTQVATRAPAPTMLAGSTEADELPVSELGGAKAPADLPNMQLDSGKKAGRHDSSVNAGQGEVLEAGPASDVGAADLVEAEEALEVSEDDDETLALGPGRAVKKGKGGEDASVLDILGEDVLVEGASEVDLGKKSGNLGSPSGVDMIAEALESGVDLSGTAAPSKPAAGKGRKRKSSEVDLEETLAAGPESSAVDLGGSHPEIVEEVEEEAGEAVVVVEEGDEEKPTAVENLDDAIGRALFEEAPAGGPASKKKAASADDDLLTAATAEEGVEGDLDEGLVVPAKKGKTKAKVVAADEDDEDPKARQRGRGDKDEPRRKGGGWLRFAASVLFGVLLAVGGLAAVWYFAPDLLKEIPESPKGVKWQVGAKSDPAVVKQLAQLEGVRAAVTKADPKADTGDLPKAVDDLAGSKQLVADEFQKTLKNLTAAKAALDAVRAAFAKADPKADVMDLPKAVAEVLDARQRAAEAVEAVTTALGEKGPLKADDLKAAIEGMKKAKEAVAELAKHFDVDRGAVAKTVLELDDTRKALDKKLKAAGEKLKGINERLAEARVKDADEKGVQELAAARDELSAAVKAALDELRKGNFVPADGDPRKQLAAAVQAARLKAESPLASGLGQMFSSLSGLGGGAAKLLQRGFDSAGQKAQLAAAKAREFLQETPEQRADTSIALYQDRGRKGDGDMDRAQKYLDWVNSEAAKAGPEAKAKALYVLGLTQRNHGLFGEALQSLKKSVDEAAGLKAAPPWLAAAKQALKEQTDSAAYYLPHARQLAQERHYKDALEQLETGLKAIPEDPRLLLQRARVRLEMAGSTGKLDDETLKLVRQDAAAAQKDAKFAAAGFYLLGRLDEQGGDLAKAEANYRKALDAHQGSPQEANVYRTALARLLLRERPAGAPPPPPPPPVKTGKAVETSRLAPEGAERLAELLVLAVTGVQPPGEEDDTPEQTARFKEVVKLANDLIKSAEPKQQGEGYMILGELYAKQGKRTDGIVAYVKGLQLYYPGKETGELAKMVMEHPAFQQEDAFARQNPVQAERHFGKGLDYFWARNYPLAEEEFKKAVSYYDQDARYPYFLGMARYRQKGRAKREAAAFAFNAGAKLEAASRPHSGHVNQSLERVQGELRQVLDRYRQKMAASQ